MTVNIKSPHIVAPDDILSKYRNLHEVRDAYARIAERDPDNAHASISAANASALLGDYEAAAKYYARAAGKGDNFEKIVVETTIERGNRMRDTQRWREAANNYEIALEYTPENRAIIVQYGHCVKEGGNPLKAEQVYFRALEIDTDADIVFQIGTTRERLGDLSGAAGFFRWALQIDGSYEHAKKAYETLTLSGVRPRQVRASTAGSVSSPLESVSSPLEEAERENDRGLSTAYDLDNDVTVVGKFGVTNGIAVHSDAFVRCLSAGGVRVVGLDTRPNESEPSYFEARRGLKMVAVDDNAPPTAVSVYCDVIANSPNDWNINKTPRSLVRLAYAVFDSSRIPAYWVSRLNRFDGVAVPDKCLVEVLERSGVSAPVFVLPLGLDYSKLNRSLLASPIEASDIGDAHGHVFKFGCISGFGQRKNIRGLIDAFLDVFASNEHVTLHIHSTLNFSNYYEQMLDYVKTRNATNVFLTCDVLNAAQYATLMNSFDVYVNASKGEGFSITPREALYLKKPTILSDNTAHRTILEAGVAMGVKTARREPAVYEGMEGISVGFQCVPDAQALKQALIYSFSNFHRLKANGNAMRDFANKYTTEALKAHYVSLAKPIDVFHGDRNAIEVDHLVTSSVPLYEKYNALKRRSKNLVPVENRSTIVVVGHDGGFFSLFNTFVSHLVWNIGKDNVTAVVPDWRISRIQTFRNQQTFTSFCYGTRADGNLWLKFFYPVQHQDFPEADYNNSRSLEQDVVIHSDFNERLEPDLTYIHAYKLYKRPDFVNWRRRYHYNLTKYVTFRDRLLSEAETFWSNNISANFVIGCHVRHPSHGIEQPGKAMPTVELFHFHLIKRLNGVRDFQIFLATDQESVFDSFRKLFGDKVVCRADVSRVTADHDAQYNSLSESERQREGFQIQHIKAANEASWSTQMGDEVIVDALLLAKCDTFIHVTSNIATAVAFLNPDIEMIYCE